MLFAVARLAGWLGPGDSTEHVSFGAILGADGKMLRTRSGAAIRLIELLQEAVDRAASVVAERSELDEAERGRVARAVGIGALKYADLSNDREKDYVFSWDRMLAMDGNTAVYLQYANASAPFSQGREGRGPVRRGRPVAEPTWRPASSWARRPKGRSP
jgi:arginyl-tRNA synthetase